MIKVLIIDHNQKRFDLLIHILQEIDDINVIGRAEIKEKGFQVASQLKADVVLMNLSINKRPESIMVTEKIINSSNSKVIVFSDIDEEKTILKAFQIGVSGYILIEQLRDIPNAVRTVYNNECPMSSIIAEKLRKDYRRLADLNLELKAKQLRSSLTRTEISILKLIDQGYTQTEISKHQFVTLQTVKNHITSINRKLGVKGSKNATKRAKMLRII